MDYLKDPAVIYRQSFAAIRAETDLAHLAPAICAIAERIVHACGMPDIVGDLRYDPAVAGAGVAALQCGRPILVDCEMVRAGIIATRLPASNRIVCTLNDPRTPGRADALRTTRSAAAVSLWREHLQDAIVAIGNAPTALFALLELLDAGALKPAAIVAFPVGFVGAAEAKAALAADSRGVPFITLLGRRGGSAMTAAALNAVAAESAP